MRIELIKLSNNFEIIHIEQKESEVVSMNLLGKAGSSFEKTPGIAHFLEHVVMCGSRKYSSKKQLESIVRKSGGYTNGTTGKEFVEYVVKVVSSEAEKGFEFLSQAAFYPLIKDRDVEKERKIILQEYGRALSSNQRQLFESMVCTAFKSKAMKKMVLGDELSIKKITTKDLKEFWTKHYTVSNFVLCVCGNISTEKVRQLGEKYFGELFSTMDKIKFIEHQPSKSATVKILHRENVSQARIALSFPAPSFSSKEYYAAQLISYILGRGTLSRLHQSIREKNQLAYDISSWIWRGYGYSLFYVEAGISENKINKVVTLIAKELKNISSKPLSLEELSMFKKQLKSYLLFGFENSLQMATYHAKHAYVSSGLTHYEDELEKVHSVTPEEIIQVAIRMFSGKPNLSILAKNINKKNIDLKPFS
jgi:predicted Zn-dependent peptidase